MVKDHYYPTLEAELQATRDLELLTKLRAHPQRRNLVGLLVRERIRGWADDASLPVGDDLFDELLQLLSPGDGKGADRG